MRHSLLPLAALVLLRGACTPPAPLVSQGTAAPPAPARDPLVGPWRLVPATGSVEQLLLVEATLTSRVDTLERIDSLHASLRATTSRIVRGPTEHLSGLLREFRTGGADTMSGTTPPGLLLPQPFAASYAEPGVPPRMLQPREGECAPAAAAVELLRDLWTNVPALLDVGTAWSDSSRVTVCRDSIPLVVTTHRAYRVTGAERRDGAVVVLVERESRSTLVGEGFQFGERIDLRGEGSGRAKLALSVAGGVVVEADGEGELLLHLQGRHRAQELRQQSRLTVRSPR